MYYVRKLKPDRSVTGLIPAMVASTAFLVTFALFGPRAAFLVIGTCFALFTVYTLLTYVRTKSTVDLASALYTGFAAAAMFLQPQAMDHGVKGPFLVALVGMVFSGLCLGYLMLNRRAKWRGRELFELAAMPVDKVGNGYTARPLPAGRVEYPRDEILAFADFVGRNLIALPIVEADRVVLRLIKMGNEFHPSVWLRPDYGGRSWVSIGFDGEVAVNLSQEDYLDYREDLSFDQLCASLGNMFVEFLELFHGGQGVRVLDRLDALQMSIFS